jgi:hypothetical protein
VRHACLETLTAGKKQDAAVYGVLTGSICNSIKAAAVTVQQEDMSALVPRSTALVITGAARAAAGTLLVDPRKDCCLKRVGRRGGLADKEQKVNASHSHILVGVHQNKDFAVLYTWLFI